ncbi:MAG: mitochondrial fission ELM1 family protein [Rickettsiales bacterium]|nr:mitochondrial fission ELM1 family protein [Rickettsiales bacterium]
MLNSVNIHIITNESNRGDLSQALGVRDALADKYSAETVVPSLYRWDADSIDMLKKHLETKNEDQATQHHVIIGVGTHGLKALTELHESRLASNVTLHWQGHQVIKGLEKNASKFTTVALPEHVLNDDIRKKLKHKTELVTTVGVSHNVTKDAIIDLDKNIKDDLLPQTRYHAVFLGGDAPTGKGKIKYFTPLEAVAFARRVADIAKEDGASVIVTNGPRTGKYDPRSSDIIGKHDGNAVDKVSEAFIDGLKGAGVKTVFYDFVYNGESKFKPIVSHISKDPQSKAFVTGESTSMLSEVGDNIIYKNLYVLPISSMNEAHEKHVDSLYRNGKANILASSKDQDRMFIGDARGAIFSANASETIANAVKDQVRDAIQAKKQGQLVADKAKAESDKGQNNSQDNSAGKIKHAYQSLQGKVAGILSAKNNAVKEAAQPRTAEQQLGQELSKMAHAINSGFKEKKSFRSRLVAERKSDDQNKSASL